MANEPESQPAASISSAIASLFDHDVAITGDARGLQHFRRLDDQEPDSYQTLVACRKSLRPARLGISLLCIKMAMDKEKEEDGKAQYPRLQCNDCRRETLQTSERNPRPRFGNLKTRRRARRQPNIPLAGPLSTMWPLSVNYHCVHDARRSPANRRGRPQRRGVQGDRFFVIRLPTRQEPPFRFRALQLWSS